MTLEQLDALVRYRIEQARETIGEADILVPVQTSFYRNAWTKGLYVIE
jgi:hypothetical protein